MVSLSSIPIRPRAATLAGVVLAIATAVAPRAAAQDARALPFAVGEELTYKVYFGRLPVGSARMRVEGVETVRGRPAYHISFSIDGGIPGFRVHDRYESWMDTATLSSLRFRQQIAEGGYKKDATYEIYPERALFQKVSTNPGDTLSASVHDPLDDGSFIFAVRAADVRAGETRRFDRYFRADRNPVVLTGLRRDTVKVGAGRFAATVIRPTIKTKGIFAEGGDAQIWFSDDAHRYPVQLKSKFAKVSMTLSLESVKPGSNAVLAEQR
jgi:hypothetical protein